MRSERSSIQTAPLRRWRHEHTPAGPAQRDERERPRTPRAPAAEGDPAALFAAHHAWIEKVAGITCRRNGVWGDDAEEFAALAAMKVVEDDFAVLRRFQGRSTLRTYLATVVVRRFCEWRRERWGRWRHSARAEQLGQTAKDLEALVHRDGYTLHQAIEVLRARGTLPGSDGEAARLFARLPPRTPHHGRAARAPSDGLASPGAADAPVLDAEREGRLGRVLEVLVAAMAHLPPEDQVLVRGRFGEGRSVADIARALRCEQAPLYRRSERLRGEIRRAMEAAGVSAGDVRECLALGEP
jgi:RNA polymerase sigma factor (sigma-70 family)